MPALPVELQVQILTDVFHSTLAASNTPSSLAWADSPQSLLLSADDDRHWLLASTFLAARSAASSSSIRRHTPSKLVPHIQDIDDPILLRAALAFALPAWHGALCGIPELWPHIVVPLDSGSWAELTAVLDAVQEALECARGQPLNVLLTCAPSEFDAYVINSWGDERVRVMQIMALLEPHINRWYDLRVYTNYPAGLPVATIDFAGKASLLTGLSLLSSLPFTHKNTTVPRAPRVLEAPQLSQLTMDVEAFRTMCLHRPDNFPVVKKLTLWGPGPNRPWSNEPAMSVRALLEYTAQMQELRELRLQGALLSVEPDHEDTEGERGDTQLRHVTRLHFRYVSAAVIAEVLNLSAVRIVDEEGDEEIQDQLEALVSRELEIVQCRLPPSPCLQATTQIMLQFIDVEEGREMITSFLESAYWCTELKVLYCKELPLGQFSKAQVRRNGLAIFRPWQLFERIWLVGRLKRFYIVGCTGTDRKTMREVVRERASACLRGEHVVELEEALLDGRLFFAEEDRPSAEAYDDYTQWMDPNMLTFLLDMRRETIQQFEA